MSENVSASMINTKSVPTNRNVVSVNPMSQVEVVVEGNDENTKVWENSISFEFPIVSVDTSGNMVVCHIGSPHNGYTIKTHQKNNMLHGDATLYNSDGRVIAVFTYQQGVENGKCTFYYSSGSIFFTGFLNNGYRHGLGVEYREDGSRSYDGFFKNGRPAPNIKEKYDGRNYWTEKDDFGNMVSLFQIDKNGLNHGVCYFYKNGVISYISKWNHGEEVEILKRFSGTTMRMFKNGCEIYRGGYRKKSDYEYIPDVPQNTSSIQKYMVADKREYEMSVLKLIISTLTSLSFIDLFVYCILVFFTNDIIVEKCIWMAYTCAVLMSICIFCILLLCCKKVKKSK